MDDLENGQIDDVDDQKMEILCLALSLLNNIVEKMEEFKDRVRLTGEYFDYRRPDRRKEQMY